MQRVYVNNLGRFLGGGSHLFEGEGGKAEEVRERLIQHLRARAMPAVKIMAVQGHVNGKDSDRPYIVTIRSPWYTSAIFAHDFGNDLYISWKTFQKPFINWLSLLFWAGFISPLLSMLFTWRDFFRWIPGLILWIAVGAMLFGAVYWAAKMGRFDVFFTTHNSSFLNEALLPLIAILGPLVIIVALFGISPSSRFPDAPLSFFIVYFILITWLFQGIDPSLEKDEPKIYPSLFDIDDALAMSFSVHKSLLHALDQVGIDINHLNLSNETIEGRVGEAV